MLPHQKGYRPSQVNPDEENVWLWAYGLNKRPELLQGGGLKVHLKEEQMHSIWGVILMFGWALYYVLDII